MRTMLLCLAVVALAACGAATGTATSSPATAGSPAATAGSPAAAAGSPVAAGAGPCGRVAAAPTYRHVVWIWMENHSYGDIIGNKAQAPYLNALASECGLATNYHNISHPSLPNYLAATSGRDRDGLPVLSWADCGPSVVCDTSAASIFGQGETWKAYQESMPSNCARSNSGEYAVRHNPPPYYEKLSGCASQDVPYTQLATDLAANAMPAFSFITPNLIDDMHDGTVADGDKWLANNLPAILESTEYRDHTTAIFKKHHMEVVGYWAPQSSDPKYKDTFIYILAHPSREAADKNWKEFQADPEWQKVKTESEKEGVLAKKVESTFMDPTSFSPMK